MKIGDPVHDGAGARGVVTRVEVYQHTNYHTVEDVYVDWSTTVLEPSLDALPEGSS